MAAAPISLELKEFLESGISLLVGSRDARLQPEVVRALGARIEEGGREVTAFVPVATSARTLANARENGRLAVCFASIDHRSYQLKGALIEARAADEQDRRLIERYRAALAQHFGLVGLPPRLTLRVAHWPAHALRVAIEDVFIQTPGPGAGVPLGVPRRGARR